MSKLSLKNKSILVTGGAGFIGSHLVDRLAAESPTRVVVVDNLFLGKSSNLDDARALLGDKLICHWQDAADIEAMREIVRKEKVQVVYDLAVIPLPASLEKPMWTVMENVKLTTSLCELQREGVFETMVHFSSSEAYGSAMFVPITEEHPLRQSTPYAASKSAGDLVALSYQHTFGLDLTVLRPFNNFGPRQNEGNFAGIIPIVIQRVQQGLPIIINGDGLQTRDYIYVTDTADAAVRMYEEPTTRGRVINIGSGVEVAVNDLVACILEVMDCRNHPIEHGPDRHGDVRRHMAGTKLAEEVFGFAPKVSLREGMKTTVEWYLSQSVKAGGASC
ncbi:MAG: NAD-dependent epimerase/dehydratase family protein [Pedosphaera sp.]|nr:NAD-dependent epimerase/dehydratase family protein [Pedosphaera sp.]